MCRNDYLATNTAVLIFLVSSPSHRMVLTRSMITLRSGMNSLEHKNTPVVQKYLGQGEEYLEEDKVTRRGGAPEEFLRSSYDEGRHDEECNFVLL